MIPTGFDEENDVLGKPPGMTADECEALSVWRGEYANGIPVVVSCWKLRKEELEEIVRTGRVWLTVLGQTMPPVAINVQSPFAPQPPPGAPHE